jgi:hypothetical protein
MKKNLLGIYLVFSQILLILQPWVTYFNLSQEEFSQLLLVRAEMIWLLSLSVLGLPLIILADESCQERSGDGKFCIFYVLVIIGSFISIVVNIIAGNELIHEVSSRIVSILILSQSIELISRSIYMKLGEREDLKKDMVLQVPLLIFLPLVGSIYGGVGCYFALVIFSNILLVLCRRRIKVFSSEQKFSVVELMDRAKSMVVVGMAGFIVAPLQSIVQRLSFEENMPDRTIEIAIVFQIYGLFQMLPSTISKIKLIVEKDNKLNKVIVRLKSALLVIVTGLILLPIFSAFLELIGIYFSDSIFAFIGVVVSVALMTFQLEYSNFRLRNKDYIYGVLMNGFWGIVVVASFYTISKFLIQERVGSVLSVSMLIGYFSMLMVNIYLHRRVESK